MQGITGRKPPKALYDDVILAAGDHPDGQRAAECYKVWCGRGYNTNAITWLTEWYVTGIPGRNGNGHGPRGSPLASMDEALEVYMRGGNGD